MRYIDNTHEVDGCNNIVLGDATCPGKRFEAWSAPSQKKFDTCMSDDAPSSKSLGAISKWCSSGDEGCNKPEICKPGQFIDYYFFSVRNPVEVLQGHPADLMEMEPVRIKKAMDRVEVDSSLLETEGTLSWREAYRFELADDSQAHLLDQEVVIPNPGMFATVLAKRGNRVAADAMTFFMGAAMFYTKFQEKITNMTSSLPTKMFTGKTAIDFSSLVKDQYRKGSFTLALGEILASQACPLLIPILGAAMGSAMPHEVSVLTMCHSGFIGNIGMSAFSTLTRAVGLNLAPSDGAFFYEVEKGCMTKSEFPGNACYLKDVCPFPETSAEYAACVEPSLTEKDANDLFSFLASLNGSEESIMGALGFLTEDCYMGIGQLRPRAKCDSVRSQLLRLGKSAVIALNPEKKKILAAHGWMGSDLDEEMGRKVAPYFIKGTIRDLMGLGESKPRKDPLTKSPLGLNLWINSLRPDGTHSAFTFGPVTQRVSSKWGSLGMGTFTNVKGRTSSCAFDYGCMAQDEFQMSGTCSIEAGKCEPSLVDGFDAGFVPGHIFGDADLGSSEFHGEGRSLKMFMPETFLAGNFVQTKSDAEWKNGLLVDEWSLAGIPAMEARNCGDLSKGASRALFCDSPRGTLNVGYQLAYDAHELGPRMLHLPLYASFPHFTNQVENTVHPGAFDPLEKLRIRPCASCPSERDFGTRLFTEPETGAHVLGSQKMQLNVRVSAKSSLSSRTPGTAGTDVHSAGIGLQENVDLLIPLFWFNRFDQAAPFQAEKLASLQSLPRTVNIIFGVCLAVAVILAGIAAWMIRRGIALKANSANGLISVQRSVTGKGFPETPVACTTDRASTFSAGGSIANSPDYDEGGVSRSSSTAPRVLSSV